MIWKLHELHILWLWPYIKHKSCEEILYLMNTLKKKAILGLIRYQLVGRGKS